MYFDTHAHYNDEAFDGDRHQIISSAIGSGVELIVNASTEEESSLASIELAEAFPQVYAAVGWHPHDAKLWDVESADKIRSWCRHQKVVAIGEIGLDYYYDLSERDVQREVFKKQLELAQELKLPVIIHDREAHAECLEMVSLFPQVSGVFHCYSGSVEMARKLLDMGWYLGFNGAITFKNAKKAPEVVAMCPADRILLETDCPYLAPVPLRGKRCDSSLVPYVTEAMAQMRGVTAEEMAAITLENGKRLFKIQ